MRPGVICKPTTGQCRLRKRFGDSFKLASENGARVTF